MFRGYGDLMISLRLGSVVAFLIPLALPGCASARGGSGVQTPDLLALASDTTLFAVVVNAIEKKPTVILQVDSRPLRASSEIVLPKASDLAPVSTAVIRGRVSVLERLGFEETDFLEPTGCPGSMGAFANPERARELCPQKDRSIIRAIVGLPRPGGAFWGGSYLASRPDSARREGEGAERGLYAVRVVQEFLTIGAGSIPPSRHLKASDYVLRRSDDGNWTLVERVPLYIVE